MPVVRLVDAMMRRRFPWMVAVVGSRAMLLMLHSDAPSPPFRSVRCRPSSLPWRWLAENGCWTCKAGPEFVVAQISCSTPGTVAMWNLGMGVVLIWYVENITSHMSSSYFSLPKPGQLSRSILRKHGYRFEGWRTPRRAQELDQGDQDPEPLHSSFDQALQVP